jgi:hypothetical protein
LNATGESDTRNYYDAINQSQELRLRRGMTALVQVQAQSKGIRLPDGWGFKFNPLWQMSDKDKGEIADRVSTAVGRMEEAAVIGRKTALKELKQSSRVTGVFSNITDEEIEAASDDPPSPSEIDEGGDLAREDDGSEEPGNAEA